MNVANHTTYTVDGDMTPMCPLYKGNVELTLCPLYAQAGAAEAGAGGEATSL